MYTIGVDVGTTHIKAILLDNNLNSLRIHIEENKVIHGEAYGCYFDVQELWEKVLSCILNVIQNVDKSLVRAIGVTSMAEAGVPIDVNGQVLYPLIPWHDMRGESQIQTVKDTIGEFEIYNKTGVICHPKHTIAKILWLKSEFPDLFPKIHQWLSVADYVIYKLTGNCVTDETLASRTMLFNIRNRQWDDELCSFIGGSRILPKVIGFGEAAGCLKEELTAQLTLGRDVLIVACGHDHISAAAAVGVDAQSTILDSMGTAEVFVGIEDTLNINQDTFKMGFNHGCFAEGKYYWMTSLPASGASVEWVRKLLSVNEEISYEMFIDEEKLNRESSLLFFPYLNGSGTPHVDYQMRGFIYGLSGNSDVYEIIKSIYEGTSYESKWIIESLENVKNIKIKKINAVGGATKNVPWIKTKSNVIGKNIQCSTIQEAAATGAAKVALKAAGSKIKENNNNVVIEYTFDAEQNRIYQEKFEVYKQVYDSLKKIK